MHCSPRCFVQTGTFALSYEGETTASIAYDADAFEMASAIGNLSTLGASNVTAEIANCTTPEQTCSWYVTFVDIYGDVELLEANADGLGGNAADVTVAQEVMGQDMADVSGSPVTVRAGCWILTCFDIFTSSYEQKEVLFYCQGVSRHVCIALLLEPPRAEILWQSCIGYEGVFMSMTNSPVMRTLGPSTLCIG